MARIRLKTIHSGKALSLAAAEIREQIRQYLQKYLGFVHPAEYDLLALWIMGTYLKPLFKCYPLLFFNAPEKNCDKP